MESVSHIIYEDTELGQLVAIEKSLTKTIRKKETIECYPLIFDEEQSSMKIDFDNKIIVKTNFLKIAK